jgi:hypothetical protein
VWLVSLYTLHLETGVTAADPFQAALEQAGLVLPDSKQSKLHAGRAAVKGQNVPGFFHACLPGRLPPIIAALTFNRAAIANH